MKIRIKSRLNENDAEKYEILDIFWESWFFFWKIKFAFKKLSSQKIRMNKLHPNSYHAVSSFFKKINIHTSLALEQVNIYLQSSVDFVFLFYLFKVNHLKNWNFIFQNEKFLWHFILKIWLTFLLEYFQKNKELREMTNVI